MIPTRVALFGGTFDPIHNGHLVVAEQSRDALNADEVWLVPTNIPAHRDQPIASAKVRLALVRAAIIGLDRVSVVTNELRRAGPSYAIDTWRELVAAYPTAEFWMVIGCDAAQTIGSWYLAGELLTEARFAIVPRMGWPEPSMAKALEWGFNEDRCTVLISVAAPEISARDVRQRIAAGQSVEDDVPKEVLRRVHAWHLYQAKGEFASPLCEPPARRVRSRRNESGSSPEALIRDNGDS